MLYKGCVLQYSIREIAQRVEHMALKNSFGPKAVCSNFSQDRHYSCLNLSRMNGQQSRHLNVPTIQVTSKRYRVDDGLDYSIFNKLIDGTTVYLDAVHDVCGLGWCSSIILATIPLRFLVAIIMHKTTLNSTVLFHQIAMDVEKYRTARMQDLSATKWKKQFPGCKTKEDAAYSIDTQVTAKTKELYEERGTNKFKPLVINFLPLPLWAAISASLRIMAGFPRGFGWVPQFPQLTRPALFTGGILWFPDLVVTDPFHILPVMMGASYLLMMTIGNLLQSPINPRLKNTVYVSAQKKRKLFQRLNVAMALVSMTILWNAPAVLQLYWVSSGLIAVGSKLILIHPNIEYRLLSAKNREYAIRQTIIQPNSYATILENFKKQLNITDSEARKTRR